MKVCSKCGIEKELSEFPNCKSTKDGLKSYCKECKKEIGKKYRLNNKEKISKQKIIYRLNNIEKVQQSIKKWQENNKEKISKAANVYYHKNKEKIRKYNKEYRLKNKEILNKKDRLRGKRIRLKRSVKDKEKINKHQRKYRKNRKEIDTLFKMTCNLRTRTCIAFKSKSWSKNNTTQKILGCDFETAHKHLEKQFTKGMNWNNYGEWHIDHIIPLASAKPEEELIKLCHYRNLQPL